jgi:hypothetical protein
MTADATLPAVGKPLTACGRGRKCSGRPGGTSIIISLTSFSLLVPIEREVIKEGEGCVGGGGGGLYSIYFTLSLTSRGEGAFMWLHMYILYSILS